jgi:hypothetical protein
MPQLIGEAHRTAINHASMPQSRDEGARALGVASGRMTRRVGYPHPAWGYRIDCC